LQDFSCQKENEVPARQRLYKGRGGRLEIKLSARKKAGRPRPFFKKRGMYKETKTKGKEKEIA